MVNLSRYDLATFCRERRWVDQRACRHAIKAGRRETCMYYHDETGRCDNPQACRNRDGEEVAD